MKKKKVMSPKAAFVSSVLSLLLCVSMFVGTTFAWFTDSVFSMNNIIQAGNLDIELEWYDPVLGWLSVNENTNVFPKDSLWEPGHTEVVYLRIKNAGSLALKYQRIGIIGFKALRQDRAEGIHNKQQQKCQNHNNRKHRYGICEKLFTVQLSALGTCQV
jgi:predicted ribosomally synthesized peptide with SipW-like signal peptide